MSESGFSGFKDLQEAMTQVDTYEYPWRGHSGFLLVGRHPSNPLFGMVEEFQHVYMQSDAIGLQRTIEPEFVPDQIAYDLVKEIYASFGLNEDVIPLFDENHNFVP